MDKTKGEDREFWAIERDRDTDRQNNRYIVGKT